MNNISDQLVEPFVMLITYIMSQSWRSLWIFFFHENLSWFWSQYALLFVSITVLQDILGSSPMHVPVPWTTLIHHVFQQILATCRVNTAFSQPCKAIPKTLPVEEHMIIARLIRPGRTLSYAGVALSETNPVLWEDATVVFLGFLCSISTLYLFEKKGIDHWPCRKPWGDANMFATNLSQHNVFFNMFYGCFMMLHVLILQWLNLQHPSESPKFSIQLVQVGWTLWTSRGSRCSLALWTASMDGSLTAWLV